MKLTSINPQFVEFIPSNLQNGVLYISRKYATAAHKCCCGCGVKIVTPLKPTDWTLKVVGQLVTLDPSIGNWNHPCQSHYFIRGNRVVWAGLMTQQQINRGRKFNDEAKKTYSDKIKNKELLVTPPTMPQPHPPISMKPAVESSWNRFMRWLLK